MRNIWTILAWSLAAYVGVVMLVNGVFMLLSPRAWFRLPWWIEARGSLSEEKYTTGWGAISIRLTGAGFIAVIGYVLYDVLHRR